MEEDAQDQEGDIIIIIVIIIIIIIYLHEINNVDVKVLTMHKQDIVALTKT